MFEVEVQMAPAQRYVSRTRHVRIEELEPFIMETIRELREGASGAPFACLRGFVLRTTLAMGSLQSRV